MCKGVLAFILKSTSKLAYTSYYICLHLSHSEVEKRYALRFMKNAFFPFKEGNISCYYYFF